MLLKKSPQKICRIEIRNNRIMGANFLNRSCAFDARLESMLLGVPPQNPFSTASVMCRSPHPRQSWVCEHTGCGSAILRAENLKLRKELLDALGPRWHESEAPAPRSVVEGLQSNGA